MSPLELIAIVLFYVIGIAGWALLIWFFVFDAIRWRRGDVAAEHPDRKRVGLDVEGFGPPEVSGPAQLDTARAGAKIGASRGER